jgi:Gluconate 2-dehydrogenase subunit 3
LWIAILRNRENLHETSRIHYPAGEVFGRVTVVHISGLTNSNYKRKRTWFVLPLRFFTANEARVIAAACERIFPSDENGPGAKEAAAIVYIDRQPAGPYGLDRHRTGKGPFVESVPEHGYARG